MDSISYRSDGGLPQGTHSDRAGSQNEQGASFNIEDSSVLRGKGDFSSDLSLIPPPGKSAAQGARAVASEKEQGVDHVVEVTDAAFDDALNNSTTPVLVNFFNPT